MEQYVSKLLDWNKKLNLISRKDEGNVWNAHILHSICPLIKIDFPLGLRILDLGSGGGLPGIPLKILRPDFTFTLLDATQKKIYAVQEMINQLGLAGTKTVWGRAEDAGQQKEHARQFDVVLARAVAPLIDLVRWAKPFLADERPDEETGRGEGRKRIQYPALIAFKGGDISLEIQGLQNQIKTKSMDVIQLVFPGSEELAMTDKKLVILPF